MKKFSLVLLLLLMVLALAACGNKEPAEAKPTATPEVKQEANIASVEIKTMPVKTDYLLGESFTADGCVLLVNMSDGTAQELPVDADGVEITAPSTDSVGNKNVVIRYGGKRATYQIKVTKEVVTVTFNYKAEGMADTSVNLEKGDSVAAPEVPAREGYDFGGWYTDEQCTIAYDFTAPVEKSATLYALWLNKAVAKYDFIFDMNQAGLENPTVVQQVQEGQMAVRLSEDPVRTGYEFAGWYTEAENGAEYDFSTAVTAGMTVYAHWNKVAMGEQTYVFEAEDTSLVGKTGPAFSGTANETGMIIYDTRHGASNDRFVGYLYQRYNSLEFFITSDVAVDNVTLVARLSAEMRDFTFNSSNFVIMVNGESCDYEDIVFTNVPKNSYNSIECLNFEDYVISTNVSLKKGMNNITLMTDNDVAMSGSTLLAAAPLVDCIKLTTSAVLTWSGTMGLPAPNY